MIDWRTIGFPEHLMLAEAASFRLSNIQIASGSQVSNFIRASGLIAQRWIGKFDMTTLTQEEWQEWDSFIARLQGQTTLFEIHSPAQNLPLGTGAGFAEDNPAYPLTGVTLTGVTLLTGATTGLVVQDQARYSQAVLIDFGAAQAGEEVLTHGDHFGIGGNLYKCVGRVTADDNGHGRVPFRWRLHKGAHEGDIVQLRKPTCRVMLQSANEGQVEMSAPFHGKTGIAFMEIPYLQ